MVEWILGRFLVRLSVISGAVVALILFMPVMYSSYWVPFTADDLEVSLVVRDPAGEPDTVIPSLLGASIDWPNNAYGLYNPQRGLFNPTPVGELIGLDPSYLRFPAGRLSQHYNWTLGVGILDDRGKNPTHGGEPQESLFGTDEFYKLVDYADASSVMVTNVNTGTAELASDWVSYCNDPSDRRLGKERTANGYPVPYGITHWEIGYEPYRPSYWKDAPASEIGYGTEYAKMLKDYSRSMKTVDRSIRVGAWMVLDPDLERSSADVNWNINFLDEIAGLPLIIDGSELNYYDYVVVKVNLPAIGSLMNFQDLYTYSYADVYASLSEDLRDLRRLIDKMEDPRDGGIPLAIAFYEPFYGEEGWNIPISANAGSALMTADMAMQFLDIALRDGVRSVEYACFGQLNTPTYSALMINPDFDQVHVDTWHRSPSYFAFQMCTELQGGKPLAISDLHPITFDAVVEKELPGHKDVPVVSAIGTLDSGSSTIKILLVNRDLDREVICKINLEIEGLSGPMQVSTRTIHFDSVLSNNLAGSAVTSPLPTTSESKTFTPPDFKVTLPIAGVVLITIEPKPEGVT